MSLDLLVGRIEAWAEEVGMTDPGVLQSRSQLAQLTACHGALAAATIHQDIRDIELAIGQAVLMLTFIAKQQGTTVEECTRKAWRGNWRDQGFVMNGAFVTRRRNQR